MYVRLSSLTAGECQARKPDVHFFTSSQDADRTARGVDHWCPADGLLDEKVSRFTDRERFLDRDRLAAIQAFEEHGLYAGRNS